MSDFFEYNEQTDMDISVLLALIKEKKMRFGQVLGYFVLNAVDIIKQMFYGADKGPNQQSLFEEVKQQLNSYPINASREELLQIIRYLSWLFVAVFVVRNRDKEQEIRGEAEVALGHPSLSEQSYIVITQSPKLNIYAVYQEFSKLCALVLRKEKLCDPAVGYIFCNVFSDLFLYAVAVNEKNPDNYI